MPRKRKTPTYPTLNAKQAAFTAAVGQLLTAATARGIQVILAEAYRTPAQAALYAKQGKGIKNSNHTKKLAVDLFVMTGGSVSWDNEHYEVLAKIWKNIHPLARWGGDFAGRDSVHFSFEHNGVR